MNRRTILQLTGVTFVTGLGSSRASASQETDSGEEGGQATEDDRQAGVCEADVRFGEQELVIDDTGFSDEVWAAVVVENTGDAPSGNIELAVEWLDGNGSLLSDTTEYFPTLGAGESWLAYVRSFEEADVVSGVEVTGDFELDPPRTPAGLSVGDTELVGDDVDPAVAGVVENSREEDLDFIYAYGLFYAEDGTILGGSSTSENDLRAGTNWGFELSYPRLPYQADDVVEFDVLLDAQSFQIRG